MPDDLEEQAEKIDHISMQLRDRAGTRMVEHTMPIHVVHGDGNPIAHGSAVLLRIADTCFLLSCAHVLEKASEPGARLLMPSEDRTPLIVLGGTDYRWTEDKRVDLACAVLPPAIVELIPASKQFLRLSDLDLNRNVPNGVYNVTGYPQEETTREDSNINSSPISFTTYLHRKRLDDHVEGVTIALIFQANATGDRSGDLARMPHLKGISGCGIWRLADMDKPAPRSWSPEEHVKLVGIEHGFVPNAIKGSHIAELIDLIRDEFPALRGSIDLHR